MVEQRDALGTSLGDLGVHALLTAVEQSEQGEGRSLNAQEIALSAIQPSPFQPRKNINNHDLIGLSESIREHGILQPIMVRPISANTYELIAGERRFRAAKIAGLDQIPAVS